MAESKDYAKLADKLMVYVDFDGTITRKDIGDELFIRMGEFEPYNSMLKAREIDIKEYWRILFEKLRPEATPESIEQFALSCEIDPYFSKFAEFCREQGIPIAIVSDGFDSYIRPILEAHGLDWIDVYCNEMVFADGSRPRPHYPYASESCECFCASCKRNSVVTRTPPDRLIAFIGDGYSDYCAAEHADIVFAKRYLAAYCNEHRLPHYTFKTFFDVLKIFKSVLPRKKLKERHQAMLKRKKAFETE
ncbi:MAG: MtnX-like HAD-IB family phosphatase [Candidatus Kapaibacterium sp.]